MTPSKATHVSSEARRIAASVLEGGGEMGALMRSIDWAKTPVGAVETWPQSLRTVLSILLPSEHPMFMWWGKELVQFYNDGYRPILGATKHPAAMGQRGRECWAEIWEVIEPMIDKVFAGGSTYTKDGLLSLNRHGFLEECYFNYAYNPIRDESGAVAGIFVACSEATHRILAERRLVLGRELSLRTALDRDVQGIFRSIEEVTGHASADLPFVLLYEIKGSTATRVACVGLERGSPAAPTKLELNDQSPWPLGTVARSGQVKLVEGLERTFGTLTCKAWPESVTRALVLPLSTGTEGNSSIVLVVGISPRLRFGDEYQNFLELLARQIGASLTATRLFEQQKQRAAELTELDRAKTAFFSNVSHEFRTPLTLILGPLEAALAQPTRCLEGEPLDLVRRNALRLQKLVNTLLEFSRLEAGRTQTRPEPTDLSALTADLASVFRSLVERAGLTLTVECPPLSEPVHLDREMYEKIVLNLISNAFKFTFHGGIRVSLNASDGRVLLTVADTGTGISEAELPHIFERFHRVEGARGRSHEGSGIGLALVQELATLQGGGVSVESRLGEGTRFTVSLPRGTAHLRPMRDEVARPSPTLGAAPFLAEASLWVRDSVQSALLSPATGQPAGSAEDVLLGSQTTSARILLADDNADMREYVGRLITEQGWKIETAGDGEQALASARARPPDLILADVMMPLLDGFGLLGALKADERTRAVPVILVSARAGEAASIEAMQKGADDYLVKPFSAKELVSRVAARLKLAREGAELLTREQTFRAQAVDERQKLHALFMQAPVAICILEGPRHTFTFANPAYRSIVGGRDVVGKPLFEALPEANSQVFSTILDHVAKTGEPFFGTENSITLVRSETGQPEEIFCNVLYSPLRNGRGEVDGVFVCCSEVTEQVHSRRRIETLLEEVKLGDQRKDEFLAMLAHELRNPLAAISLALSMLERADGDVVKSAKHRETALRQVGRLVRLVDDLLDVSRITRGAVELSKERIDFVALVEHALTSTRPTLQAQGHELSVTLPAGPLWMHADATRLEQVLVNLITNASKYTDPGGAISVRLKREVVDGAGQAVVSVRDNGRGIPKDMLEKVFELFVQVSPSIDRKTGGLGLGLTLVKGLAEMHGGSVSAHSDDGRKGSEFVVRLPLTVGLPESAAVTLPASLSVPAPQRQRVLLVEDSEDVRETLKDFLEELGHEVVVAEDGLKGMAMVLELRPDVVLVDVGLPGIDGYELARRVRATPGGDSMYLVALTGYGGPVAKAKAKEAGFDLHITKPIATEELSRVASGLKPRWPVSIPG